MSAPLILIADDDPGIREVLAFQLEDAGYQVLQACHGAEAFKIYQEQQPDLLLTDLRMPIQDGHALLQSVLEIDPFATVIVMTAYASVEAAVDIMKTGAFDFLVKPFKEEEVLSILERGIQVAKLKGENKRLRKALQATQDGELQSRSDKMQLVYQQAHSIADTDANVLINGETGTGKEHLAQSIHRHSHRAGSAWIVVNCGALPEQLVEAELFGHTKGAFTGASQARDGRIAAADNGTLLLDEIGDLPLSAQVKLLRFLQEGEIQAIGADAPRHVDVRVIAATHKDLHAMMKEGSFREDLYYRLSVITLHLPALRERREDIMPLANMFLEQSAASHNRQPASFTPAGAKLIENFGWPGNVRQLKNLCERWVLLYANKELNSETLQADLSSNTQSSSWELPPEGVNLAELERQLIEQALARTQGNKSQAARLLGISRHTLDYRLEKYKIK
ncbi:MAG: sigma-54 dependent transcriptional regulator [Gammaproteobacteria bacterium]|nr:sigma-54 dependent transcriptional regulator [Gammaproteobacteria bacterium]MCF6230043.1 sigma-54 dependent transcriptional regulator [Gammaproteobacteria bacterium]